MLVLLRNVALVLTVDPAKLTTYALNRHHPRGRHKARIFEAILGYNLENYGSLLKEIETKALDSQAQLLHVDEHGHHYRVDIDIVGANGNQATVRTGWLIMPGQNNAVLTTLYVRG
jgi:filamentous hemagglutinin